MTIAKRKALSRHCNTRKGQELHSLAHCSMGSRGSQEVYL